MKKLVSILLTLAVAVSLLVVPAVVSAADPGIELSTGTTGIAKWSTDQKYSGSYSVYLHATEPNADSYGQVQLEVAPIPMAGFTGVSFFVWELASTVHGGQFPGAWNIPYPYGDPYIVIMLDTDSDGVGDDFLVGTASYTKDNVPASEGVTHTGPTPETWVEMAEGYGFRDSNGSLNLLGTVTTSHLWYAGMVDGPDLVPSTDHPVWRINDVGTIGEWQDWFATNAPSVTVVGVRIQFGAWLDDPGMGVYVDSVTISGTLYDLEPGPTGVVGLTATVPDIVAISVTPPSIDFGTVYPGQTASGPNIVVTNIGTHEVDVDALIPVGTVLSNLELSTGSGWLDRMNWIGIITGLVQGTSAGPIQTKLPVPTGYTPGGTESATLVFKATGV